MAFGVASSSRWQTSHAGDPVTVLSRWDGAHFAGVASNGYSTEPGREKEFAFFPLLPLVSRALGGQAHAVLAGIILNQLLLLASLILLARLSGVSQATPLRANPSFWLLISPVGFFLSVYYSESLFLFLTLVAVIAYRKEWLWLAVAAGVLAGLSRPLAITLPVLFLWDIYSRYRHDKLRPGYFVAAISPWVGLGAYVAYVGYRMHDALAYPHIQSRFWGRSWAIPFHPIVREAHSIEHAMLNSGRWSIAECVQVFSTLAALALLRWGWRKIDRNFLFYTAASLLFVHSQSPYGMTARYEMVLFPLFVLVALFAASRPITAGVIAVLTAGLQAALFLDFAGGRWVS
jgi:mannosyltransferase PIG-V